MNAASSPMNIASVQSVAFLLGYTVNHVTCIFIYTVYIHIVYIVCARVCICVCVLQC